MRTFVITDRESLEQTLEAAGRGDKIVIAEGAFPVQPRLEHDGTRWREVPAAPSVTITSTSTGWKVWTTSYPATVYPAPARPVPPVMPARRRIAWDVGPDGVVTGRLIE